MIMSSEAMNILFPPTVKRTKKAKPIMEVKLLTKPSKLIQFDQKVQDYYVNQIVTPDTELVFNDPLNEYSHLLTGRYLTSLITLAYYDSIDAKGLEEAISLTRKNRSQPWEFVMNTG